MGRTYKKNTRRHKGDKPLKERYRTKRKTKDLDEIQHDMKPTNAGKLLSQPVDLDKTGAGQHYCLHCAKYFVSEDAMKSHFKGRYHKRRVKNLSIEAFTQEESERAAGMGSFKAAQKVTVEPQTLTSEMEVVKPTE